MTSAKNLSSDGGGGGVVCATSRNKREELQFGWGRGPLCGYMDGLDVERSSLYV